MKWNFWPLAIEKEELSINKIRAYANLGNWIRIINRQKTTEFFAAAGRIIKSGNPFFFQMKKKKQIEHFMLIYVIWILSCIFPASHFSLSNQVEMLQTSISTNVLGCLFKVLTISKANFLSLRFVNCIWLRIFDVKANNLRYWNMKRSKDKRNADIRLFCCGCCCCCVQQDYFNATNFLPTPAKKANAQKLIRNEICAVG